jgi:hypothetical protein
MKTILSMLTLSVILPLSANAASYSCRNHNRASADYPARFALTVQGKSVFVNGHKLRWTTYKGSSVGKIGGSRLLYSISGEYRGQAAAFIFDPTNASFRAVDGSLRAVAKYICE